DAQLSVMRPAAWASYNKLDIDGRDHTVWTNIWAITAKKNFTLDKKFKLYFEGGISNVARHGFTAKKKEIVDDAQYLYPLFGSGLVYKLSHKWDASINATYSPPRDKVNQPATTFIAAGITYNLRELDQEVIERNSNTPYFFPKHILQVGYSSDEAGFDINRQFSGGLKTSIPIFWNGDIFVKNGLFINYQRNIFHTLKSFSFDWGASVGFYETQNNESFYTLSVFPVVRWWFLRTKPLDVYFNYSLIGPAYISKSVLDGVDSGEEATFQDFMGIGFLLGKERHINIDLRIGHYSNGNIFNDNHGVAVPLMLSFGYALY
ncbi:MAG: acyloxyacyl hydrolase, partial [Leeuwenhoekiella sp.]